MSDYETIQRRRNVIVGIFVVAGMCALGWLVFKFGDMPGLVSRIGSYNVFVQFAKAPGVQRDTPVRFCGYQIGRVTAVQRPRPMRDVKTNEFYHQTLVVLSIDNSYKDIPADVNVVLLTKGFGSSYIELQLAHYDVNEPNVLVLAPGGPPLQGSTGVTSEFIPEEMQKELRKFVARMDTLAEHANDILGDQTNKDNVKRLIDNLAGLSGQARDRLEEAEETLKRLNRTLDTVHCELREARPMVEWIGKLAEQGTKTLEETTPNLVETSEQLAKSLSEARLILQKINSGEGSAGRFVTDAKLYETLVENIDQVELLLKEIKAFVSRAREKGVPIKLK